MNPQDAAKASLQTGDMLNLYSHFKGEIRQANNWFLIEYNIPRGNIATYFPEANELIPLTSTAYGSNTPTSKSVRVTIERIQD
jgi:anaerobic selenocysteine-containing dehydrogenase